MFTMLEKIEIFLKENNINLNQMKLDGEIIDDYFRTAVTNIIRRGAYKNNDPQIYLDDADYYLKRDINGELYIEAISHNQKYKVFICRDRERGLAVSTDDNTFLYSQKAVMQDAAIYKILRNVRKRIREEINANENFKSLTPLVKRKIEFTKMGIILKHMYENNRGKVFTLYDQSNYCYDNQSTVDNIINVIKEKYSKEGIFYRKVETINTREKNPDNNTQYKIHTGRIYPEIPFDERAKVLEKYNPLFINYCYSESKNEIEYMSYLYHLGDGYYALILEPYKPNTYTKLFLFDEFIDEMNEEKFNQKTREFLQLPDDSKFKDKTAYRFSHTTMKNFESIMSCIFDGKSETIDHRINAKRHKKRS